MNLWIAAGVLALTLGGQSAAGNSPDRDRCIPGSAMATAAGPQGSTVGTGLWLMNRDGSDQHLLVEGLENGQSVTWSPDGSQLAFVERNGSLTVIGPEGSSPKVLTQPRAYSPSTNSWSGESVSDPAWSPDGNHIAFASSTNFETLDIHIVDREGANRRVLVRDGREPAWSPNGDRIAFTRMTGEGDSQIELLDLDQGKQQVLVGEKGMSYSHPTWEPSGFGLAFASAPHDDWAWISVVTQDGSEAHSITPCQLKPIPGEPAWSPDGTRVAFADGRGIASIAPDGSSSLRLTATAGDHAPAWSPDGSKIAFFRY